MALESQNSPQNNEADGDNAEWLFDGETLRALAHLARDENLDEVEIEVGAKRVSLRANPDRETAPLYAPQGYAAAPNFAVAQGFAGAENAPAISGATPTNTSGAEAKSANTSDVICPMVGVFYRAPSPNDDSFVEIGDTVEVGQTLGLVETMKVFNEITSEVAGVVKEIKAETAQLVETGDVLMTIQKP